MPWRGVRRVCAVGVACEALCKKFAQHPPIHPSLKVACPGTRKHRLAYRDSDLTHAHRHAAEVRHDAPRADDAQERSGEQPA